MVEVQANHPNDIGYTSRLSDGRLVLWTVGSNSWAMILQEDEKRVLQPGYMCQEKLDTTEETEIREMTQEERMMFDALMRE